MFPLPPPRPPARPSLGYPLILQLKFFLFGKPVNKVFILGQALVLSAVCALTPLIRKQSNEVSIITPPVSALD